MCVDVGQTIAFRGLLAMGEDRSSAAVKIAFRRRDRPLEAVLSNSAPIPAAVVAQPFQAAIG
jgi:hypothetical protein